MTIVKASRRYYLGRRRISTRAIYTFFELLAALLSLSFIAQAEPFRPLLFIPGLLGTQLLNSKNEVVWGDAASFKRFADLEMTEAAPVVPLHPGPLIQKVSVLGPFWAVHQYDGLLALLRSLGFREGENLFIFTYDWRYSNFDNAASLKQFIASRPQLRNRDFDVLAHSMGGLIAKIYLQDSAAAIHVKRLINLGVPALGSMNALADMSTGWGGFENWLAGGIDVIRRVLFSFPALYELIPRYDNCCRIAKEHMEREGQAFDPLNPAIWLQADWLPPEHRAPVRWAKIQQGLSNARRLGEIIRGGLPSSIEETNFTGDHIATLYYLYVDPDNRTWRRWRFSKARGDGTVAVWSAAHSLDLTAALPSFAEHATLFDDRWVADKLRLLLDHGTGPPQVSGPSGFRAATKSGATFQVGLVETALERMFVQVGQSSRISVAATLADYPPPAGEFAPTALVFGPDGTAVALIFTDISSPADLAAHLVRFSAVLTPQFSGDYSIRITLPGLGSYVRDLIAVSN